MKYRKILKQIAHENNISKKEVEKEMKLALRLAGMECSVKQFVEDTKYAIKGLYIV